MNVNVRSHLFMSTPPPLVLIITGVPLGITDTLHVLAVQCAPLYPLVHILECNK